MSESTASQIEARDAGGSLAAKATTTSTSMQFNFVGFVQDGEFRVFAFEGIRADRSKTPFSIRTDLSIARKHGIRVQELPLLCRGILERSIEREQTPPLVFAEEDMRLHEQTCKDARDAAIQKKKTPRRHPPSTERTGLGWRATSNNNNTAPDRTQLPGRV